MYASFIKLTTPTNEFLYIVEGFTYKWNGKSVHVISQTRPTLHEISSYLLAGCEPHSTGWFDSDDHDARLKQITEIHTL